MKVTLAAYPSYRDSGVAWFGDVPDCWRVVPLYALAKPKSVRGVPERELLSVYLDRGVVRFSDVAEKRTNVTSEDLSKYQAVDPGDFVLNNQQAWRGSVGVATLSGIVSPAYLVLSLSRDIDTEYANLLFRDRSMVDQYLVCSKGVGSIQRNLYWPYLKRARTLLPSAEEQVSIVRYVDHINRRIRRYIRAKQKLIKLLEEQKQATIHQAVTGQIDVRSGKPYPAYKDSGIEWLGQVPEHWEVRRLRNVVDLRVSNVDKLTLEDENPVQLCNYVDVYKNERITDRLQFMSATASDEEVLRFRLEEGDVLITKDSEMWNDIGVPALVEWSAPSLVCGYHLAILRPRAALIWGEYLLRAMQDTTVAYQLHVEANGVTRYGLSQDAIKSAWIPLPPMPEQVDIAGHIDEALNDIDTSTENARRSIELLREYRTRLIADVVTGKLDVGEAATNLPDEAEEPELLEDENLIADEDQAEGIAEEEAALEGVEV